MATSAGLAGETTSVPPDMYLYSLALVAIPNISLKGKHSRRLFSCIINPLGCYHAWSRHVSI